MKHMLFGFALFCSIGWVSSTTAAPARLNVEASMTVEGTITVSPQGTVIGYALKQPGKLPTVVTSLLAEAIPTWRFEPVLKDGKPVTARSHIGVRILALPRPNKRYDVRIASTWFTVPASKNPAMHHEPKRQPPIYPLEVRRSGVSGNVFLILRVGYDGQVKKAAVERVNLMTRGREKQMARWRELLGKAALDAAHTWHFPVPHRLSHNQGAHWDVRVPVLFRIGASHHRPDHDYGSWTLFIPGPKQYIPWHTHRLVADGHSRTPSRTFDMAIDQKLHRIDTATGS